MGILCNAGTVLCDAAQVAHDGLILGGAMDLLLFLTKQMRVRLSDPGWTDEPDPRGYMTGRLPEGKSRRIRAASVEWLGDRIEWWSAELG